MDEEEVVEVDAIITSVEVVVVLEEDGSTIISTSHRATATIAPALQVDIRNATMQVRRIEGYLLITIPTMKGILRTTTPAISTEGQTILTTIALTLRSEETRITIKVEEDFHERISITSSETR
jgi:hypothetical protein